MKRVFVNPQWQGGADPVTLNGADELIKLYLDGVDLIKLPVSADLNEMARKSNGIKGFEVLRGQMLSAYDRLRAEAPDKLFTLGGGCDADVPDLVYLSEKYREGLTVLWLDAHGDFPNTPLPAADGLYRDEVFEILNAVSAKLTGLGVYEYAPSGTRNDFIEKLIQFGLAL